MDSFDLVFGCVALFFIVMLIKNAFKYVIGESSLVSIFVYMLGLLSVASLRVDKDKTIEAYNIIKDMFIKSVESKSSLELAI